MERAPVRGDAPKRTAEAFREDPAFQWLLGACEYSGVAVGFEGRISENVVAFRALLHRVDARSAFDALWREACVGGKLYALCGLWHVDPDAFRERLPVLEASEEVIPAYSGCVSSMTRVQYIVRSDDPFTIRLDYHGQTFDEWTEEHGIDAAPYARLGTDIAGGGIPAIFAEEGDPGYGESADDALRDALRRLDHGEGDEVSGARWELGRDHGDDGRRALCDRLRDADPRDRLEILDALAEGVSAIPPVVRAVPEECVPAIVEVLRETEHAVIPPYSDGLALADELHYAAIEALTFTRESVRVPCDVVAAELRALPRIREPAHDEPVFLADLIDARTPDDRLRRLVEGFAYVDGATFAEPRMRLARRCGPQVLPDIRDVVLDPASPHRFSAFHVFFDRGDESPPWLVGELERLLEPDDRELITLAILCLSRCPPGGVSSEAVDRIRAVISDGGDVERAVASFALWRLRNEPMPAIEHVLSSPSLWESLFRHAGDPIDLALADAEAVFALARVARAREGVEPERFEEHEARVAVIELLARIGPAARGAISALERVVHEDDSRVALAAGRAIWKISGRVDTYLERISRELQGDRRPAERVAAARCVRELGREAAVLVPVLEGGLESGTRDVVRAFVWALASIGAFELQDASLLEALLRDPETRSAAVTLLPVVDANLTETRDVLTDLLTDLDVDVRIDATRALVECPESEARRRMLESLRGDPSGAIRWVVKRALTRGVSE